MLTITDTDKVVVNKEEVYTKIEIQLQQTKQLLQ